MVKGRCFTEGKEVTMKDVKYFQNSMGRPIAVGVCPNDGTRVVRTLSAADVPADQRGKLPVYKSASKSRSKGKKSKSGGKRGGGKRGKGSRSKSRGKSH